MDRFSIVNGKSDRASCIQASLQWVRASSQFEMRWQIYSRIMNVISVELCKNVEMQQLFKCVLDVLQM